MCVSLLFKKVREEGALIRGGEGGGEGKAFVRNYPLSGGRLLGRRHVSERRRPLERERLLERGCSSERGCLLERGRSLVCGCLLEREYL